MTTGNTNSTIDQSEVDRFSAMAAEWWNPSGKFRPLHKFNPVRLTYIKQQVCERFGRDINDPKAFKGLRFLDIGCGGGILAEGLAAKGAQVTAIDMAKGSLSVAKLHLLESGLDINYIHSTAEQLAAKQAEKYDVVCCLEMLEHVPDPSSVIASCQQLLKPGGQLFLSTINRNPKAYALAIVGAEYVLQMLKKGTHDYKKFIRPSELASWARKVGLELHDVTGMSYNPITQKYSLGRDVDVNYLMYLSRP